MMQNFLPRIGLLLAFAACHGLLPASSAIAAQEESPAVSASASEQGNADEEIIDSTRRHARSFAYWIGDNLNSWFGDKPFSEGGKVSHGRLSLRSRWQEKDGSSTSVSFRARLSLPNLKDKAYIFFGQENEKELVSDQPETFSREQQLLYESRKSDQAGFFGLGINLHDYVDFRVGVRGGIKPYAQARYRRQWLLSDADRAEFRETLFWRVHDGFGSTTAFSLEHLYSPSLSLKWQNAATVTKDTDGFAWSSSLGLFKVFAQTRLLSFEALAGGETGSSVDVGEYGLRMKWKQPVLREWLLAEVIVGHFWPKEKDRSERERSWAAGVGLEMRF